jgi:cyclopropane-fatty-acyl-phospholipid synthase
MKPVNDRNVRRSIAVLRRLFGRDYARQFAVKFWDGTLVPANEREAFVLCLNAPYTLRAMLSPPVDLNSSRTFVEGAVDVEGNLEAAIDLFRRVARGTNRWSKAFLALGLARLPRPPKPSDAGAAQLEGPVHSRKRDAAAIGFHYNQPLAFYQTFLDPDLVYSCAYFDDGVATLEDAQDAKLDYVLRKLRLSASESLLDIGCGWGSLVIRAAQRGARALGITLSRLQYEEAQRRIAAAGLGDRARVELRDYRDLGDAAFDKIASIGMVEHVGRERLDEYFGAAFRALRPGGLFLNHGIAEEDAPRTGQRPAGFLAAYVFPDGDLLPVSMMLGYAERAGFEVRDVESLREHYARTLRAWVGNLESHAAAAIAVADKRTYRIWRLYMAGSAQGFASRRVGIFQSLLARPHPDGRVELPATRRDLYR